MAQADHPRLRIEYCGEEYSVTPGTALTFGRSADIVIDDNRFLHRVLGEFRSGNGLWWVANVGSSIAISVQDDAGPSMARLAPGISMPLTFDAATLRFDAGGTSYEISVDTLGSVGPHADTNRAHDDDDLDLGDLDLDLDRDDEDRDDEDRDDDGARSEMTTTTTNLPLTDDQFAVLLALAAPMLRGEGRLPTNRQLASQLGWTVTKYNRKLDGLCSKFAKAGVAGLHGSADQLAKDRRTRLAEHVVHAGIVRVEHLD